MLRQYHNEIGTVGTHAEILHLELNSETDGLRVFLKRYKCIF